MGEMEELKALSTAFPFRLVSVKSTKIALGNTADVQLGYWDGSRGLRVK